MNVQKLKIILNLNSNIRILSVPNRILIFDRSNEYFASSNNSATVVAKCVWRLAQNGYWMSLAWCVVLFAPLLAVAQRLARLYRRPDPYPGPLVEAYVHPPTPTHGHAHST